MRGRETIGVKALRGRETIGVNALRGRETIAVKCSAAEGTNGTTETKAPIAMSLQQPAAQAATPGQPAGVAAATTPSQLLQGSQTLPATFYQADWANREAIEALSQGIRRLADFLTRFGTTAGRPFADPCSPATALTARGHGGRGRFRDLDLAARYQLSRVDEKLSLLERKLALLEAEVGGPASRPRGASAPELTGVGPARQPFVAPPAARARTGQRRHGVTGRLSSLLVPIVQYCAPLRVRDYTRLLCSCARARGGTLAREHGDQRVRRPDGHQHLVRVERQRRDRPDPLSQKAVVVADGRQRLAVIRKHFDLLHGRPAEAAARARPAAPHARASAAGVG